MISEPVGRSIYWPCIAVLLMLVARNPWWDNWPWHWPLVLIFCVNIGLAAASSIILQRAASAARRNGIQRLKEKLNEKRRKLAGSVIEHESSQAELLIDEINNLQRGAFAPISKNPLVGALLLNSSGLVLVQILVTFFSK